MLYNFYFALFIQKGIVLEEKEEEEEERKRRREILILIRLLSSLDLYQISQFLIMFFFV